MPNPYFRFKQFTIHQDRCAMKVTTDGCLFGAWVADRLKEPGVTNEASTYNVLDIGAGTGLLSLMIAQAHPRATIDAIEIDTDSFEQASENFNDSPWTDRLHAIQADAAGFVYPSQYNAIVSNPPFYENEIRSNTSQKNVAHHDQGLVMDELFVIIKRNLAPEGRFFILLPYKRIREMELLLKKNALRIVQQTLVRQSTQHDFFRVMIEGTHAGETGNIITNELSICDEKNQYTLEFIGLLKNYYLSL